MPEGASDDHSNLHSGRWLGDLAVKEKLHKSRLIRGSSPDVIQVLLRGRQRMNVDQNLIIWGCDCR